MAQARTTLPKEIRDVKSLIGKSPASGSLLKALLAMLRDAPDQSIIDAALRGIDPSGYTPDLRADAAALLAATHDAELSLLWREGAAETSASSRHIGNVIGFTRTAAAREDQATGPTTIGFDDIGGLEDVKAQMRRKIIKPFLNRGLFQQFRRKSGGGILMYGPPGCGKTLLARALASECGARFMNVTAAEILAPYAGIAERRLAELFASARKTRPVVLFFDEIEALAQKREADGRSGVNTVVSSLLTEMDGFAANNEGLLLLGATNVPWSLDGAFRRPGRFDRTLFVPPPDKLARRFILGNLLTDRPVAPDIDLAPVVARTSGYSGADLASLVETAVDFAIEDSEAGGDLRPISQEHLLDALREVRASTGEWLAQAANVSEFGNRDGLYDDLKAFLAAHGR